MHVEPIWANIKTFSVYKHVVADMYIPMEDAYTESPWDCHAKNHFWHPFATSQLRAAATPSRHRTVVILATGQMFLHNQCHILVYNLGQPVVFCSDQYCYEWIDPLASNDRCIGWKKHHVPTVFHLESLQFICHSILPTCDISSLGIISWNRNGNWRSKLHRKTISIRENWNMTRVSQNRVTFTRSVMSLRSRHGWWISSESSWKQYFGVSLINLSNH